MQRHLFGHVNLPARRIHFLNGAAADVGRECARYERAIARAGGIDLQILGLGANGHIGFNEPAPALVAPTHRDAADARPRGAPTPRSSAIGARAVPREALSMGMATILQARRIVLLATGAGKARGRAADGRGTGDAARAGVVPAAARRRRGVAGPGGRGADRLR